MSKFIKIKANNQSIGQRKPIFGVGTNDADYMVQPTVNNKQITCPVYMKWKQMLQRCYSEDSLIKHPTYIGCYVASDWLLFSTFSKWFNDNNINGLELDKDLKIKGNKIYSPDTCLFVPHEINSLLTNCIGRIAPFQNGSSFHKASGKIQCAITIDGKQRYLGLFSNHEDASSSYIAAKNIEINRKAKQYPAFSKYLLQHLLVEVKEVIFNEKEKAE